MAAFLSPQENTMTLSGIIVIAVLVILVGSLLAAFIWSESGEDEISEFKKNKNM
jgi:hypothetical protein